MLVYGDHTRACDPREVLTALRLGATSHDDLVAAFITAAELAQGLADDEAATAGHDVRGPNAERAMAVVLELARAIAISWDGGDVELAAVTDALGVLAAGSLPALVRTKRAE
ncbi:MAG TPA: hypothetical protein VK427_06015, partial [Kofleriaceae bacterium]|nr:hypothetical protein [Kofleriaceae bacterium]